MVPIENIYNIDKITKRNMQNDLNLTTGKKGGCKSVSNNLRKHMGCGQKNKYTEFDGNTIDL